MKMMDETERDQSLPVGEINVLRIEAMAVYERCLADATTLPFERFLERQRSFSADPFTAAEFHLISSLLTPQGPNYRHEASFPLNG